MKRILALAALILALGSLPFGAFALGLGNIDLHSALGQKLDADIVLVGANKDTASTLTVSLASPDAFQRAQVERTAILQSLKFQVVPDADGYHIHVTSSEPVREPFLTFLVAARWSSGQMLREYTVLLDPPNYAASGAAAPAVAQSAPAESAPQESVPQASQPVRQAVEPVSAMPAPSGNYGPIRRGETLWGIARKLTSGAPADVDRMMIAVYRANPNAFSGNINRMKAGYVLHVPDANAVNEVSLPQAIATIKRAHQEFLATAGAPAATTPEAAAKTASPAAEPAAPAPAPTVASASDATKPAEAHLQLVAPSDNADDAKAAPGAGQDTAQTVELKQQLQAAKQDAADAAAKTAALAAQVNDLKQQLQKNQRLLTLKDKQLTQIQNRVQELESKQHAADEVSGVDRVIGFVTRPVFLIGVVIVIVLVIGGAVVRRQQRKPASGKPAQPTGGAAGARQKDDDADAAATEAVATAEPAAMPAVEAEATPVATDEGSDPIAEADFHIDYGLYDQAAEIVRAGIAADPDRSALKLKLFQIYFAAGDAAAFRGAAQEFASDWGADNPAEWAEVTTMGRQLAPNEPLFAAGFDESALEIPATPTEMPTEIATEVGVDTAMDFKAADDVDEIVADPRDEAFDLDIDLDGPVAADTSPVAESAAPAEQPVENAIEFEPAAEAPAVEPESAGAPKDFGTGTEMDFSELEAELDPAEKPVETPRSLLDTQTEFEDAIRELSEFVDTNFPNETQDESQTVAFDAGQDDEPFVSTQPMAADAPDDDVFAGDDDVDEMDTKLDLARAYMDMGDPDGARGILEEVLEEGSAAHQEKARSLLDKVG